MDAKIKPPRTPPLRKNAANTRLEASVPGTQLTEAKAETERVRAEAAAANKKQAALASVELAKANALTERLKAEAAAALDAVERSRIALVESSYANKVRFRITAVVMVTAAVIKLAYVASQTPQALPHVTAPILAASLITNPDSTQFNSSTGAAKDDQFNISLHRLAGAFRSFPGRDQMDIVHEINRKYPTGPMACPLVWNNGSPVLFVGQKPLPLTMALNQCAEEVEKLRREQSPSNGGSTNQIGSNHPPDEASVVSRLAGSNVNSPSNTTSISRR